MDTQRIENVTDLIKQATFRDGHDRVTVSRNTLLGLLVDYAMDTSDERDELLYAMKLWLEDDECWQ